MRPPIDLPVIILTGAALVLAVIAYLKDPGLPMLGAQTRFKGSRALSSPPSPVS